MLAGVIDLYSFVVLAAVVLSWMQVSPYQPIARLIYGLTEPVLEPMRRLLPPLAGLDFSPMVLLLLLQFLKEAVS